MRAAHEGRLNVCTVLILNNPPARAMRYRSEVAPPSANTVEPHAMCHERRISAREATATSVPLR